MFIVGPDWIKVVHSEKYTQYGVVDVWLLG